MIRRLLMTGRMIVSRTCGEERHFYTVDYTIVHDFDPFNPSSSNVLPMRDSRIRLIGVTLAVFLTEMRLSISETAHTTLLHVGSHNGRL
jgi:hypothetical protein